MISIPAVKVCDATTVASSTAADYIKSKSLHESGIFNKNSRYIGTNGTVFGLKEMSNI